MVAMSMSSFLHPKVQVLDKVVEIIVAVSLNSSIHPEVQVLDMKTSTPDFEIWCLAYLSTPLSLGALNQVQNNF